MVTINPKRRHEEIVAKREARHEEIPADQPYLCIETVTWTDTERQLNYWGSHGWRMVAIRDGIRTGTDLGYRLVFERR